MVNGIESKILEFFNEKIKCPVKTVLRVNYNRNLNNYIVIHKGKFLSSLDFDKSKTAF